MRQARTGVTELRGRLTELESELAELRRSAGLAREAENRLRSLVDQASDPVFCYECTPPLSIDLPISEQVARLYDCLLVECNDACAQTYGYESAEEVVGRKLTDLFGTSSGSLDRLFNETVRNDYRTVDGEGIEILPDGSKRFFLNNAHGVIENGKLLRIWGTFREVTKQRLAEEALREERELAEAAWAAQRDTYFLFEPETGKAIRWNRAFREITGYTDEEIAEIPAPASYYDLEDLERAKTFVERLPESGTGTIELDLICKDGRRVPTEYCAAVVSDRENEPRYLIAIGRDISERKKAEEELRKQQERLIQFGDSATDSFHLVDSEYRIVNINERALQALRGVVPDVETGADVVGKNLFEVYPFLRDEGGEIRFREVLETRQPALFDDAVDHPTLGTVYMTVRAFPVGDDLGIIATDVSALKRAEEDRLRLERQMQHEQKLESLGVLAGGIAHDFNNLLVGVVGGVDLALEHVDSSSPARGFLQEVTKAANRASDLANQMLAYSGRGRYTVEPTNLSDLVQEMSELVQASISKKIPIVYALDEQLPAVDVDVTQVRQIVLNLVLNAAEAIGSDGGAIRLETATRECRREELGAMLLGDEAEAGSYVCLKVEDTGAGMDDKTLSLIFDPFFTTKSTGRGLGLAAALGIVRSHRGAIRVESEPGRGTTINVLFPTSERPTNNQKVSSQSEGSWTGSGLVLLVDDEEMVRSVASAMLGKLGFEVLQAEDGLQGLETFRRHADEIVLVILDLAMPQMSGDQALAEMRRVKSDVSVLLSSGFDEVDVPRELGAGPSGFIQKPYRLETFRREIRRALGS